MRHPTRDVQTKTSSTSDNHNNGSSNRRSKRSRTSTVSLKPSRKTRTKRRKPKYLSLNLKLSLQKSPQPSKKKTKMATHKKQQLNLFPLHPENLVDDNRDMHEDNNVAASFLFEAATDSTTTLNGLLSTTTTPTVTATNNSEESPLSTPSLTYAYRGGGQDNSEEGDSNDGLVRTAMRCKERDVSEERWVSYSKVVEKSIKEEDVNSCVEDDDDGDDDDHVGGGAWCAKQAQSQKRKSLLDLKLDYQQILKAWSGKGPLYVEGESPQTVPDLHDDSVRKINLAT